MPRVLADRLAEVGLGGDPDPSRFGPFERRIEEVFDLSDAALLLRDPTIAFQLCAEQQFYFNHLTGLAGRFIAALDPMTAMCDTQGTFTRCTSDARIPVTAGELLSTEAVDPQWSTHAFDFGARDARLPTPAFVNLDRYGYHREDGFDLYHVLCPWDAYAPDLKAVAYNLLGAGFGNGSGTSTPPRTVAPVCGTTMQDVVDTAAGNWFTYDVDGNLPREDLAISLAIDPFTGTRGAISIGGPSNVGLGAHYFTPNSSGRINRLFAAVPAGDGVYCYEGLADQLNNPSDGIVVVEATADAKLRIERQTATSTCVFDEDELLRAERAPSRNELRSIDRREGSPAAAYRRSELRGPARVVRGPATKGKVARCGRSTQRPKFIAVVVTVLHTTLENDDSPAEL